jgi:hypothetical protein
MDVIGYLILFGVGYFALKAFGGKPAVFPGNDPATGVPLINSAAIPSFRPGVVGPQPAPSRIPATWTSPNNSYYCPLGTVLYKDVADGKFYCYDPTELANVASTTPILGPTPAQLGENPPYGALQPTMAQLTGSDVVPLLADAPLAFPDVVQGDPNAPVSGLDPSVIPYGSTSGTNV